MRPQKIDTKKKFRKCRSRQHLSPTSDQYCSLHLHLQGEHSPKPYKSQEHLQLKQQIRSLTQQNNQLKKRINLMQSVMNQVYQDKKKYKQRYKELLQQHRLSIRNESEKSNHQKTKRQEFTQGIKKCSHHHNHHHNHHYNHHNRKYDDYQCRNPNPNSDSAFEGLILSDNFVSNSNESKRKNYLNKKNRKIIKQNSTHDHNIESESDCDCDNNYFCTDNTQEIRNKIKNKDKDKDRKKIDSFASQSRCKRNDCGKIKQLAHPRQSRDRSCSHKANVKNSIYQSSQYTTLHTLPNSSRHSSKAAQSHPQPILQRAKGNFQQIVVVDDDGVGVNPINNFNSNKRVFKNSNKSCQTPTTTNTTAVTSKNSSKAPQIGKIHSSTEGLSSIMVGGGVLASEQQPQHDISVSGSQSIEKILLLEGGKQQMNQQQDKEQQYQKQVTQAQCLQQQQLLLKRSTSAVSGSELESKLLQTSGQMRTPSSKSKQKEQERVALLNSPCVNGKIRSISKKSIKQKKQKQLKQQKGQKKFKQKKFNRKLQPQTKIQVKTQMHPQIYSSQPQVEDKFYQPALERMAVQLSKLTAILKQSSQASKKRHLQQNCHRCCRSLDNHDDGNGNGAGSGQFAVVAKQMQYSKQQPLNQALNQAQLQTNCIHQDSQSFSAIQFVQIKKLLEEMFFKIITIQQNTQHQEKPKQESEEKHKNKQTIAQPAKLQGQQTIPVPLTVQNTSFQQLPLQMNDKDGKQSATQLITAIKQLQKQQFQQQLLQQQQQQQFMLVNHQKLGHSHFNQHQLLQKPPPQKQTFRKRGSPITRRNRSKLFLKEIQDIGRDLSEWKVVTKTQQPERMHLDYDSCEYCQQQEQDKITRAKQQEQEQVQVKEYGKKYFNFND